MLSATTEGDFPNRISLNCGSFQGPFTSSQLGAFDPRKNLSVYIDGILTPIQTWYFDNSSNRYLLFTNLTINLQGVIQLVHNMPSSPFEDILSDTLYGFAILASFQNNATGWGVAWGQTWG